MKSMSLAAVAFFLLFAASPAGADWVVGDPCKMHFPQLPDPNGLDVCMTHVTLADDFMCSSTGPVSDVHFWASWKGGNVGMITNIHLSIHADIPARQSPYGYSMPGPLLWQWDTGTNYTIREDGEGCQGWLCPEIPYLNPLDHTAYYQVNVTNIPNPFMQEQGVIYWLDIQATVTGGVLGWKTSKDDWNDDAVWWSMLDQRWVELVDPVSCESLDLAFVITPEPATIFMLGLGGVFLVLRRRSA